MRMMLSVMATGVAAVSFRAGSWRTPQRTASSHPRRQSTRATLIARMRNARKPMVIRAGRRRERVGQPTHFVLPEQLTPRAGQATSQRQATQFADKFRGDGPRMRGVKTGQDVLPQPSQDVREKRLPSRDG